MSRNHQRSDQRYRERPILRVYDLERNAHRPVRITSWFIHRINNAGKKICRGREDECPRCRSLPSRNPSELGRVGRRSGVERPAGPYRNACTARVIDGRKTVANLHDDDYVDSRDICVRNWNRISIVSILVGDCTGREGRSVPAAAAAAAGMCCLRRSALEPVSPAPIVEVSDNESGRMTAWLKQRRKTGRRWRR